MSDASELDCTRCGLCCFAWSWNGRNLPFVEVDDREGKKIHKKHPGLVVVDTTPPTGMIFKQPNSLTLAIKNGRCAALRGTMLKKVSCSIYEDRPRACRDFKPGDSICLSIRRRKGL